MEPGFKLLATYNRGGHTYEMALVLTEGQVNSPEFRDLLVQFVSRLEQAVQVVCGLSRPFLSPPKPITVPDPV